MKASVSTEVKARLISGRSSESIVAVMAACGVMMMGFGPSGAFITHAARVTAVWPSVRSAT